MTSDNIYRALDNARTFALAELLSNPNDKRAICARLGNDVVKPVADAIRDVQELKELEGLYCYTLSGAHEIDFDRIAGHLIERTLEIDPREISDDLIRLFTERRYKWVEVRFLEYLDLPERVDFGDGFSAMAMEDLPPGYRPRSIDQRGLMRANWPDPVVMTPIVRERWVEFKVDKAPVDDSHFFPPEETLPSEWDAILHSLILAGNGAPKWGVTYEFAADPGWIAMTRGASGSGGSHFGPVEVMDEIDTVKAIEFFGRLRKPDPAINLALKLLTKARRKRFDLEEKVIDLGTCAEVLLMNKSKDNNEITMKLALRSAWFLNGGAEKRRSTFATIRELYRLRSSAVHTGAKPRRTDYREIRECITNADALLVELVEKLLVEGMPADSDWNDIMLDAV